MRYIRYAFWGVLGLLLLIVATANRGSVTVNVLPDELAGFIGWNYAVALPLFLVIFGGIVAGLFIGFVWEWLREHKHRAAAAEHRRARAKLEREVDRLKEPEPGSGDDVLALLENPSGRR